MVMSDSKLDSKPDQETYLERLSIPIAHPLNGWHFIEAIG